MAVSYKLYAHKPELTRVLDYDKPVGQRDFKLVKSVTYKEIQEKFKKEEMDKINSTIEKYKKTKNYERGTCIND